MYHGLSVGTAAAALSLATNLTATILTGYKAWCVPYVVPPLSITNLTGHIVMI